MAEFFEDFSAVEIGMRAQTTIKAGCEECPYDQQFTVVIPRLVGMMVLLHPECNTLTANHVPLTVKEEVVPLVNGEAVGGSMGQIIGGGGECSMLCKRSPWILRDARERLFAFAQEADPRSRLVVQINNEEGC